MSAQCETTAKRATGASMSVFERYRRREKDGSVCGERMGNATAGNGWR
jgi:hypothetical protein